MYKLGKLPARFPASLPRLRDRLTAPLPTPVLPYGYGLADSFPMALNNAYGDCTIAGKAHLDQVFATAVNQPYTYPGDAAILAGYAQLLGCTVEQLTSDPSQYDHGLDLATVITAWSSPAGFLGSRIVGAASIEVKDYELLESAAYSFGALYVGVQLPTTAQTQFPGTWHNVSTGQPTEGGHCVILNGAQTVALTGTNAKGGSATWPGMNLVSWGAQLAATQAWLKNFLDEVWVVIPEAYVTANHDALAAINLVQMQADITSLQDASQAK